MEQQTQAESVEQPRPFGDACEQWAQQIAAWGEEFGRRMEAWAAEFGPRMEAWGKEFEQRMEAWGKEFGPRMEAWAEELTQHLERMGRQVREWLEEEKPAAASSDGLREERLAILRMVEEGKVDVAEAEKLLRALGE